MHSRPITFVGGGNMARSLIGGLMAQSPPPDDVRVLDPDASARDTVHGRWGIAATDDPAAALAGAGIVVLAIKPQLMGQVLPTLRPHLDDTPPLVISVAAGITTATLAHLLERPVPLVRAMPNTPALLGCGATALFAPDGVGAAEREDAEHILRAAGIVVWVESEAQMDAVTAVSGSGPAYFFLLMESLIAAGVAEGLAPDTARLLVIETALGAARMCLESDEDPGALRRQVTSPGGTTQAAMEMLEAGGFGPLVGRAVGAATTRGRELAADLAPKEDPGTP
jgi:pyrroline-5-carboxylate reductase